MWPITRKEEPFPWTARTTTTPKAERTELKYLLASGGTVNVHFWNAKKDFRYRQIGDRLEKI